MFCSSDICEICHIDSMNKLIISTCLRSVGSWQNVCPARARARLSSVVEHTVFRPPNKTTNVYVLYTPLQHRYENRRTPLKWASFFVVFQSAPLNNLACSSEAQQNITYKHSYTKQSYIARIAILCARACVRVMSEGFHGDFVKVLVAAVLCRRFVTPASRQKNTATKTQKNLYISAVKTASPPPSSCFRAHTI